MDIATSVATCYGKDVGSVGARLLELRSRAGLSRPELGRRAGMSSEGIRKLENGDTKRPSNEVLARLAAVFGLTVDELTGERVLRETHADYEPKDPQLERIQINLKAVKRLDPEALDHLETIILAVAEKAEREAQS